MRIERFKTVAFKSMRSLLAGVLVICFAVPAPLFAGDYQRGGIRLIDRRVRSSETAYRGDRCESDSVERRATRERSRKCDCHRVYREGFYRTVCEEVVVPGYHEKVWVPSRFETRLQFGCHFSVKVGGGYYERIWHPESTRLIEKQVWVPGCFEWIRCKRHA